MSAALVFKEVQRNTELGKSFPRCQTAAQTDGSSSVCSLFLKTGFLGLCAWHLSFFLPDWKRLGLSSLKTPSITLLLHGTPPVKTLLLSFLWVTPANLVFPHSHTQLLTCTCFKCPPCCSLHSLVFVSKAASSAAHMSVGDTCVHR